MRNTNSHWYETFWGSPKQSHESHCGESCSSNMVSEPCPELQRSQLRGGALCSRGVVGNDHKFISEEY